MTWATVDSFLLAIPGEEAIQISNPPDAFATEPDRANIQRALDQSASEILSELGARFDREILVASTSKDLESIQIALARWALDRDVVGRPRDFIYKDAEDRRLRLRRMSRGEAALEYTPPESSVPVISDPTPSMVPIVSVGESIYKGDNWWAG